MSDNPSISSQVGSQLLFENDQVRVWDLRIEPGESSGVHRHTTDYLYVVIGDGTLQGADAQDNRSEAHAMHDGEVRFNTVDGEAIHQAFNAGDTPWRNIIVELKKG
jgi:quercetin dioxygenase-like cupin family protein